MKKEFVRLELLQNLFADEADNEAWVANVLTSVGTEGYGLAGTDGYDTKELSASEVDFEDVSVFCFMGNAYEQERFYVKEAFTVREKATGDYYALSTEELFEV